MEATRSAKPYATATIEPTGRRAELPREHLITVVIRLDSSDARYADKSYVTDVTRKSLGGFPSEMGAPDRRGVRELLARRKPGVVGGKQVVVGVEGTAVWPGRPREDSVEQLRASLTCEGYRVVVSEKRECSEPHCTTDALVQWNQPADVPSGWYSSRICAKHNYRTCVKCKSVFMLSSTSSSIHAPSVHCEVCGWLLVEWGSSKTWTAELITKGCAPPS